MKYFIILLIASFVFFGCDANNAGDDSGIDSGDGSPQDDGSGSNEDEDPQDDSGIGNADDDPQVADLCLGVGTSSTTHTLDDGKDYTIIRDQEGLQAISADLAVNYLLCADIDIDPTSTFAQLNPNTDIDNDSSTFDGTEFTGTFNGNNKTISNLRIQASQDYYVGLFGKIGADGEVRNLTLSLAEAANGPGISGSDYVGALAGRNEGTITNVRVTEGYVRGSYDIGGLVGYNDGTIAQSHASSSVEGEYFYTGGLAGRNEGTIRNSYATDSVTGYSETGGLVGYNNGTIRNSYATDSVEGLSEYTGGLVGYNDGTIEQSHATGSVTGISIPTTSTYIGGLVGYNNDGGTIAQSHATGSVTGNSNVGGLVGHNNDGGTIAQSYATGSVEGITSIHTTNTYIGGLVGHNNDGGTIEQSHATGAVKGEQYVGGLVGASNGEIAQSYATGSVTGNSNVGGLVGYNSSTGTIIASYFDATTTGQPQLVDNQGADDYTRGTAYYTNLTDGKVYTLANGTGDLIENYDFPTWDFTDIWAWQDDGQWPILQFQITMTTQ